MSDWVAYVVGALVVVFAAAVVNVVADLLTSSTKRALKPVWKRVAEKQCAACDGKGTAPCSKCSGEGDLSKVVSKTGPCPACKGGRFTQVPCPRCGGVGSLSRSLRFTSTAAVRTWWSLMPFPIGWHERVSVKVTNSDERVGLFTVNLSVGTPPVPTQSRNQKVPAGEDRTWNFDFRVPTRNGLSSTYEVIPETFSATCGECQGTKVRNAECKSCGATGIVNESTTIDETCAECSGKGMKTCAACAGTGRVSRF
jgi:hypothetical protein